MAINRTQTLVLGFFALAWASLVALFAAAPEVHGRALGFSSAAARLLFLAAPSAFIALLGMGGVRRWHWTFWLILVAFLFGSLRVVVSVLALGGLLLPDRPTWYVLYQALLGLLQFAIALFMLAGYRRAGAWGRSEALPPAVDRPRGHRLSCPLSLERVEGVVSEVHYQHPALGEPTWKFLDRETVGVSVGQEV